MTILFHHKCLPNEFYTPLIILAWLDYIGGWGVVMFFKFYYSFYIYKPVLFWREFPFALLKISLCIHTFLFIYGYYACLLFSLWMFFMDVLYLSCWILSMQLLCPFDKHPSFFVYSLALWNNRMFQTYTVFFLAPGMKSAWNLNGAYFL